MFTTDKARAKLVALIQPPPKTQNHCDEPLVAADPTVTLDEIEGALRDAAGSAYVIGTADRFEVVIGMPAWLAALAEARVTAAENRAALGDTHPAVLPK